MSELDREVERQFKEIRSRAAEVAPEQELKEKLRDSLQHNTPLRVKYGIDPTFPHIHIGHLVPCRMIRTFQDLGHTAVLIIGDHTARIGDPSGRDAERPGLSADQVNANMALYGEQLYQVVDKSRAELHYQSTWFDAMTLDEVLRLLSNFSVAQMLSHETFRNRVTAGSRLSLHELVYPAMQAYDSVMVRADIEIGGTDQLFNCLCGRDLQRSAGASPQVVVAVPLLMGPDGQKMSKSLGNHISVDLAAGEIVGRIMSIPDELLEQYVILTTDWSDEERAAVLNGLRDARLHPRDVKLQVAENVAAKLRNAKEAKDAVAEFNRIFSDRRPPQSVPRVVIDSEAIRVIDLLVYCKLASSKSEARRLVEQRGVRIDSVVVLSIDEMVQFEEDLPKLIQAGKRRFVEISSAGSERE